MHILASPIRRTRVGTTEMRETEPDEDAISARVIARLADADDTDAVLMDPPIYRAIDLEALDNLYRSGTRGRVRFEYEGRVVDVRTCDGSTDVTVRDPQ